MEIGNDERSCVAVAMLYASLDQARSASFLIAHDVEQSIFGALILLRSQIDQLMRAAFFAGPASADQVRHFLANDELPLDNGNRLGPRSLSRINAEFYGWQPADCVPTLVDNSWGALSGMTHGGRALLNYYIGEDGIGPYAPTDEFIEVLSNAVVLAHVAIAVALYIAANKESQVVQESLHGWHKAGQLYFAKWGRAVAQDAVLSTTH